ncbi:unnamed protein product [Lactuca virosa]|uniref:Uncharacterized protein n=1 Tax=Lactuca virosa TaxID=75947 RepID=A0AAU9NCR7_9ASTR|nr:unnamed protein product [Lactuca virosa]
MPIVTGVAGSNIQGAISQQTDMVDPLPDLDGILRRQSREMVHMPQLPQTDYRPQLLQTDYRSQSPQMFLRTGGNDGFYDYCFEGAYAEATFRSPHTPHTLMALNTPLTPHGSASRGISGGHGSNASDFHASSLPLISRDGEKFVDQKIHSACIRLFWENLNRLCAQFSDTPIEALTRFGEKLMGKPPTHYDVFMKTHGTAESKKRYFEGNHENLEYCSQTAKEAQEAYLQGLVNKYGEDPANHKDDVDVWEERQLRRKGKKKGAAYGIGASDIRFLVPETPSCQSTRSTQSDNTQQEVDRLRAQVSIME